MIWIISLGMCLVLAIAFLAVFRPGILAIFFHPGAKKKQADPQQYLNAIRGTKY